MTGRVRWQTAAMRARAAILATLAAGGLAVPAASTAADAVYCNARFAYCVAYPPALLRPAPEAADGDGRAFRARDPRVTVLVYGAQEAAPRTLRRGYRTAVAFIRAQHGRFTARSLGRNRYVVGGVVDRGRTVVFEVGRRERVGGAPVVQTLALRYPAARRAVWGPVARRMAASLR